MTPSFDGRWKAEGLSIRTHTQRDPDYFWLMMKPMSKLGKAPISEIGHFSFFWPKSAWGPWNWEISYGLSTKFYHQPDVIWAPLGVRSNAEVLSFSTHFDSKQYLASSWICDENRYSIVHDWAFSKNCLLNPKIWFSRPLPGNFCPQPGVVWGWLKVRWIAEDLYFPKQNHFGRSE